MSEKRKHQGTRLLCDVFERDGPYCRAQKLRIVKTNDNPISSQPRWVECLAPAPLGRGIGDTAHIFPRRTCGRAWAHPDVAIRMCRRCHVDYDGGSKAVRVSPGRVQRAIDRILEMNPYLPESEKVSLRERAITGKLGQSRGLAGVA